MLQFASKRYFNQIFQFFSRKKLKISCFIDFLPCRSQILISLTFYEFNFFVSLNKKKEELCNFYYSDRKFIIWWIYKNSAWLGFEASLWYHWLSSRFRGFPNSAITRTIYMPKVIKFNILISRQLVFAIGEKSFLIRLWTIEISL